MKEITRHESGAQFTPTDFASFYVGYDYRSKIDEYKRFRRNEVRYVTTRTDLTWDKFTLNAGYSYDIEDSKNRETDISLSYNQQCYKIIGSVLIDDIEESYHLNIVLFGLGD